jgi:hypothetical protein
MIPRFRVINQIDKLETGSRRALFVAKILSLIAAWISRAIGKC